MMHLSKKLNVDNLNTVLSSLTESLEQPTICFLTGSSGCGKTFLSKAMEEGLDKNHATVAYFDSIGIPTEEEMINEYGSVEAWQKAITSQWVEKIIAMHDKKLVIFEGQYHPQFAIEAINKFDVKKHTLSVVTCNEKVWESRLRGPRQQPELIDDNMRNWASLLLQETVKLGGSVIDTSESNLEINISEFVGLVLPVLKGTITQ